MYPFINVTIISATCPYGALILVAILPQKRQHSGARIKYVGRYCSDGTYTLPLHQDIPTDASLLQTYSIPGICKLALEYTEVVNNRYRAFYFIDMEPVCHWDDTCQRPAFA